MNRALAHIERIRNVEPIEGADKIEKATILGWEVVIKKDEFKIGDLVVYIEIDSILPEREEFEFLREKKFRIRTVRMRGQISQGIAFPLSILPDGIQIEEGLDVTEALNIQKYEPPIPAQLSGIVKGRFPSFIPKTDETRIQSVPDVLVRHKGKMFYISEKLDGSSATYYLRDSEFGVCSRNLELKETDQNTFWVIARKNDIENKLRAYGRDVAVQGEVIGPGIQKNRYKLKQPSLFIFSVFDIDNYKYADFKEFTEFALKYGFDTVPILNTEYVLNNTVEELVELSKGMSKLNEEIQREGIVMRTLIECQDEELGRLSFKVVNPEYLLMYE
ncbi:RNA ligase (ATP) [Candidatus Poribacteria bacterium]|nr:RNA ligase (ATP) [Candidatus Poribacteria bacterium]